VAITPVERGGAVTFSGFIRDISERKALEQQLRQAQKMEAVGQLAGGVSHDFNNLLTGITGYTQLALQQLPDDAPVTDDLRKVLEVAGKAARLTRQLLAFSRRQTLEFKVFNLNGLVANTSEMLKRLISVNVEIEFLAAPDVGNVRADPGQIEQVLVNLVVNSRDAMPEGGKLTIETGDVTLDEAYCDQHAGVRPGRYVMLAVTDTGCGMDEETQQKIFEPFFTTKKAEEGTGLGLATVYGIVKQHEGNIWVYSEPGKGTTFKVYLPTVAEMAEELGPKAELEPARRGSELILLVEDQEDVRDVARRALEAQGYEVLAAAGPREAEELFAEHLGEIELLVIDVVMPEMDGPTLCRQLSDKSPSLKVLYMSGYAERAMLRNGVLGPGRPFIPKPFTPAQLLKKVREVLDKSQG
ncbi:MAG: ATP-binding protein, partial [Acidobacteriota bacterium]